MKSKFYHNPARFISLFTFVVFLSLIIQGTFESIHAQWTMHIIDSNSNYTAFMEAFDVDNDQDMDLFVAEEYAGKILFYENNKNISWTKHYLHTGGGQPDGLELADIDNDGSMDLIAGFLGADIVACYKNNGENPIHWIKDTINNSYDGPAGLKAADINGDGDMDVVVKYYNTGEVVWYENNLEAGWSEHLIGKTKWHRGYLDIADVNDDDKPDIVRSVPEENKVILFLNNLPDNNWSEIIIDEDMQNTQCSKFADIDNDGDIDIASTVSGGISSEVDLVWFENDGTGLTWTKHPISMTLSGVFWLDIIDLDTNNYVDVVVGARGIDSDVIICFNEDGGQNWTEYVVDDNFKTINHIFSYDIDLDGDYDIVPTRDIDDPSIWVWYENPLGSAYASSFTASPFLIQSQNDTLTVKATMYNRDSHPVNAWVVITGDQSGFVDTLQLFDDGLHGDEDSLDNVWGNNRITSDLQEDGFTVELFTYDSTYGDTLGFRNPHRFFTLGPIEFESYSIDPDFFCNKTVPEPGGCLNLKLTLTNNSSTAPAINISAELISLDTLISFFSNSSDFPDILAGDSTISSNKYMIVISEQCPGDTMIPIEVIISSYDQVCWRDTFSIFVQKSPTSLNDIQSLIVKIYPNPTIDLITIETSQPGQHFIEITSLNGQLLYTDRMEGPTHQIDLSSIEKGLYFITIRSRDFVRTEKIIKQR